MSDRHGSFQSSPVFFAPNKQIVCKRRVAGLPLPIGGVARVLGLLWWTNDTTQSVLL